MARPRLAVGTAGAIQIVPLVADAAGRWVPAPPGAKPARWRARTRFRDDDGVVRVIERLAPTRGKADTAIRQAIRDRQAPRVGDQLSASMTVRDAGAVWLAQVARDDRLAPRTRVQYRRTWDRYVAPSSLADVTLTEANRVPMLRRFLQGVADERGSGAAKSTRSVLSLMLRMAVHDGVLDVNAALQVPAPRRAPGLPSTTSRPRDTRRAFTSSERAHLIATTRADDGVGHHRRGDVGDLVAFLGGVGTRLGEALAVRWEGVDWAAGTVHVPGTKTATSDRTLKVADWVLDVLHGRWIAEGRPGSGYVFHSPLGGLEDRRDERAVWRALRRAFDRAGYDWATPHTLRRTVATLLDAAGVPIATIADYLGHADPSVTARVYLGRGGDTSRAAAAL